MRMRLCLLYGPFDDVLYRGGCTQDLILQRLLIYQSDVALQECGSRQGTADHEQTQGIFLMYIFSVLGSSHTFIIFNFIDMVRSNSKRGSLIAGALK